MENERINWCSKCYYTPKQTSEPMPWHCKNCEPGNPPSNFITEEELKERDKQHRKERNAYRWHSFKNTLKIIFRVLTNLMLIYYTVTYKSFWLLMLTNIYITTVLIAEYHNDIVKHLKYSEALIKLQQEHINKLYKDLLDLKYHERRK